MMVEDMEVNSTQDISLTISTNNNRVPSERASHAHTTTER